MFDPTPVGGPPNPRLMEAIQEIDLLEVAEQRQVIVWCGEGAELVEVVLRTDVRVRRTGVRVSRTGGKGGRELARVEGSAGWIERSTDWELTGWVGGRVTMPSSWLHFSEKEGGEG